MIVVYRCVVYWCEWQISMVVAVLVGLLCNQLLVTRANMISMRSRILQHVAVSIPVTEPEVVLVSVANVMVLCDWTVPSAEQIPCISSLIVSMDRSMDRLF